MSKFCTQCGAALSDNAHFCSHCGSSAEEGISTPVVNTPAADSSSVIEALTTCRRLLAPMQAKYDARRNTQEWLSTKTNYFLLYVVFIVIGYVLGNALDHTFWEMGIQMLGVLSCWIGIGLVVPILITIKIKSNERNQTALLAKLNTELEENLHRCNLPIQLPFEYSDPKVIDVLIEILKHGRADTLKEAINCMLDDQYKATALKKQQDLNESSNRQSLLSLAILMKMNKK